MTLWYTTKTKAKITPWSDPFNNRRECEIDKYPRQDVGGLQLIGRAELIYFASIVTLHRVELPAPPRIGEPQNRGWSLSGRMLQPSSSLSILFFSILLCRKDEQF